jgi:hypothetical protein
LFILSFCTLSATESARFPRAGNYVSSFIAVRLDSARASRDAVRAPAIVCAKAIFGTNSQNTGRIWGYSGIRGLFFSLSECRFSI